MNVTIRDMREEDIPEVDRVLRLAFGTFVNLPDPMTVFGDVEYVRPRFHNRAVAKQVAELDGRIIASCFSTRWGSVGYGGPISVLPEYWERDVAQRLLAGSMEQFARWGTRLQGLFTFSHSPKHVFLYQKSDFWPHYIAPAISKPVRVGTNVEGWSRLSALPEADRQRALAACRALAGELYEGLDLTDELETVVKLGIGDGVLVWEGNRPLEGRLMGFAVSHFNKGSEAGSDACSIKFGAARPGPEAAQSFSRLVDAWEALAAQVGAKNLTAVINTCHRNAWQMLVKRGFRASQIGVIMHRGGGYGYHRPDFYVLDDWR